jgi:hypothetical protein
MSMQQASQLALEKGYKFSKPVDSGKNWKTYILIKDGPSLGFCGNILSSIDKSYESNLHEFTNLLTQWKSSLGEPIPEAKQQYANGSPISSLRYVWSGDDNVRRDISFWQFGSQATEISFGYSYISHPCNTGVKSN